ncbi:TPA: hypothetical protein ACQRGV_003666 [Pseudomonas aeruginosa]|uniref:hypothetical protein n=1 Tax=Pseudomonas aeruginosa TaxID=287 RepID=UPI000F61AECE|nr:hypothetical protein [Pseudomonas aeruginosa]MBG7365229.1 hypothetical protein [Pseudomonas aeruginosa]MBH8904095.1 hypothetical protein [Pseudomonas aeruginosa]MCO2076482.1 hypothetical protein [Pseudomonas aeruginosa]MCV6272726.1 hypothetical protein [Pseudomonas aeruginosa]MDH4704876.1 hypothetical protein [Pseudomonas aeruginosa]
MISARVISIALACLLLVGLGAAGGVWLGARHYRPQLDQAAQGLTACRAARGNLESLVGQQNAAIAGLADQAEQRQAKAAQAVVDAQQQAGQRFAAAQRLQQERAEGDQCAAAEAVIDKELGL